MAKVLAVLSSPRKEGFTSGLLKKAVSGIESRDVQVETVYLSDYKLYPCRSCFFCIGDEQHRCQMKDDMGEMGNGKLIPKIDSANGIIVADPVYCWNMSARAHLFFERLYSMQWSGKLSGMPFAAITCATNQGFMREALSQICKLAFTYKFRYVDALAGHASYYPQAESEAYYIGEKLGDAARRDAEKRVPLEDVEAFMMYLDSFWSPSEKYLENLSAQSGEWKESLLYKLASQGRFKTEEGKVNLEKANNILREALINIKLGDMEKAIRNIADVSAYWTEATWHEYVKQSMKAKKPAAYRPVKD